MPLNTTITGRLQASRRSFLSGKRMTVRRRLRPRIRPPEVDLVYANGVWLNKPESMIYHALTELDIAFTPQKALGGGRRLGGAMLDFDLPDYGVDLDYYGPFHLTDIGAVKDFNRAVVRQRYGRRVIALYEHDLPRLKTRILELLGAPVVWATATRR